VLKHWLPTALGNPNFARYALGSVFNTSSFWVQRLCFGWLAWELTGSEFWVGLVAFLLFFPVVLFGPFFGVLADRVNRQKAAVTVLTIAVFTLLLLAAAHLGGVLGVELLCVFAAGIGVITSAYSPLRMAMIASLVERHELASAVATGAIIFNLSRLVGPAVAGFIINYAGAGIAILVSVAMVMPMIITLPRLVFRNDRSGAPPKRGLRSLQEGLVYVRRHPRIVNFLLLSAVISVFGRGILELLPAFADGMFERGSSGLAMMTAAAGVGAIIAGFLLARRSPESLIPLSLGSLGCIVILFSMSHSFEIGLLLVALMGFSITICGVGTQTLLQILVDEDYRGRVMSIWGVVGFGGTAIGGLLIGLVSSSIGLSGATLAAGCCCLAGAFLLWKSVTSSTPSTRY